jgi:hypothetical protein
MYKYYKESQVIEGIKRFIQEHGHEPTAQEVDACDYLPSARQIQRNSGGLRTLRQKMGLTTIDHTAGTTRIKKAKEVNERANAHEAQLINALFTKHHDSKEFSKTVVRQFAYQQWLPDEGYYINISCDVAITDRVKEHVTLIDFFYPNDMASFGGCIRSKLAKLKKHPVSLFDCTHTVLFVCVNPEITDEQISNSPAANRKIKTISLDKFKELYL